MTQEPIPLLKEANALLENRDYAAAAARYREMLKQSPGNAAAYMGLAMVHNRTGQPEEALRIFHKVWKIIARSKAKKNVSSKAAILAQIGLAQLQLGQLTEALKSFRKANALLPSDELMERIRKLENLLENPNTIVQLLIRAKQLLQAKNLDAAAKAYQAALQINADHPEALHGLGLVLHAKKDPEGALPLIQQAIMLAPDHAHYYNDVGILFQDLGKYDKAISFHKRALKVDPEFVPAHINLGVAYKRGGKIKEAIAAYRKAIALQPGSSVAHNNLGNLLRVQGDLAGARKELVRAIELQPDNQDAIKNLALLEQEEIQAQSAATQKNIH
jgi:tetratricopeptide (TPR) repeat protein